MPDGAEKLALMKSTEPIRKRIASAGWIVIALQTIALVLMALAHYIRRLGSEKIAAEIRAVSVGVVRREIDLGSLTPADGRD